MTNMRYVRTLVVGKCSPSSPCQLVLVLSVEDRRWRKRVDLHFCVWQQQLFCLTLQKLKMGCKKEHVSV